jgi:hypothetical protein
VSSPGPNSFTRFLTNATSVVDARLSEASTLLHRLFRDFRVSGGSIGGGAVGRRTAAVAVRNRLL